MKNEITMKKYLTNKDPLFWVDDLLPMSNIDKNIRLLFIFESPHINEMALKIPVCGPTGIRVLNKLNPEYKNEYKSLGCFVKTKMYNTNIGIINICNVPLQKIQCKNDMFSWINDLEIERCDNKLKPKSWKPKQEILDAFDNKCSELNIHEHLADDAMIVLFGRFAEVYYLSSEFGKNLQDSISIQVIKLIHPSSPHWINVDKIEKYKEDWGHVKTYFNELINSQNK